MTSIQIPGGGEAHALRELEDAVARCAVNGGRMALLAVHVDQLERVGTALGPTAASRLSGLLRAQLQQALRDGDSIVPIQHKKFWILLQGLRNQGHAELAAGKFGRLGKGSFPVDDYEIKLEPVIGLALFPEHGSDAGSLARNAELALAAARESGAPFRTFRETDAGEVVDLWAVEHEFDRALDQSEFELFYQPKISLDTGAPCGAEALLRWNNPARGQLSPGSFMPIAEKSGRIEAITWFAIDAAQRQRSEWPERWGRLPVSINIPPAVLDSGQLIPHLLASMPIWGSAAGDLVLEITEDSVVRNPERSFAALAQLRARGVKVSIDDFGSGYSSLVSFKDMPADELKIDRSLVDALDTNEGNQHIVRAVIELAHRFGHRVVAEGVETEPVAAVLRAMHCDVAQGYLFGRPMPQEVFVEWLRSFEPSQTR
jgi:EAL domain-containing protein (putative c-di-GMP-specific phosphodiesterase class I)/GGDEF domain-containing protein